MRQTEIDYQVLLNGNVKFVAFRNIADMNEIEVELVGPKSHHYYCGRSYYTLATIDKPNTVRIHNEHEHLKYNSHDDFSVGETYLFPHWEFFINFLKAAGERYTKIHHAKEEPLPIKTVKI